MAFDITKVKLQSWLAAADCHGFSPSFYGKVEGKKGKQGENLGKVGHKWLS